jgi:beta-galactosidase
VIFDVHRIGDPEFINHNRLPAHSDHRWFRDRGEADAGTSGFEQSLNGAWKFHFAANPGATVPGFERPGFDVEAWEEIAVPGHIQLQGHDRPQYSNVQYPWDGLEEVTPGEVPQVWNPVGSYVRDFELDAPLGDGERLSVMFHGAESGIAVWCNGTYVGWATDSFTPSEFDLTPHLTEGVNRLAAQVFKWTSGSWLEDQDFFRFSGIFRDVVLYRRPAAHLEDIRVTTTLSDDFGGAEVAIDLRLAGSGTVRATLEGVGQLSDAGASRLAVQFGAPHLWSAEDPFLYTLVLEVIDDKGEVTEVVTQSVGLRRVQIVDGIFLVNGKRVVFHGVNRHEFGRNGRAMTADEIEEDIRIIKRGNIDAVRTSHYPNSSAFYALCDRYGLYVIDEMNLETHAMWDRIAMGGAPVEEALPGDRPEWRAALLDRAESMVERDKNHPSVVIWSCGNESYGGGLLLEVSEYFHKADSSRPVHYEGVQWDTRFPHTSDITSQMYTPAADIEAHLAVHRDKPFILCEYAHSMGNSFGAVDKYLDLADREPHFQGGFIWDFADQALPLVDRYGVPFEGYGGDFGEAPTDYDFSANGIVFADRSTKPAFEEVRYLYQPFRTRIDSQGVTIENRRLFTSTSDVDLRVELAREGESLAIVVTDTAVAAGSSETYPLPFALPTDGGEFTVTAEYRLRAATAWAPAGYVVGWQQEVFTPDAASAPVGASPPPRVANGIHNVGVHGENFSALFSRLYGTLVSYRNGSPDGGGTELLRDRPFPSFWHAPTSNERGWGMPARDGHWLLASRYAHPRRGAQRPSVTHHEDSVELGFEYDLPTSPASTSTVAYRVFGDGRVEVHVTLDPGEGLLAPPEFGFPITVDASVRRWRWYGDGPHESYADRRGSARLGVWEADVHDALTPYVRPQESGSRTGVRWAEVVDDHGVGLRFECAEGMEFSALPWTPHEVENALHPNELPPIHRTTVRPALARRGVGGDNSWGAMTHPEFELPTGPLSFRFSFQGVQGR